MVFNVIIILKRYFQRKHKNKKYNMKHESVIKMQIH